MGKVTAAVMDADGVKFVVALMQDRVLDDPAIAGQQLTAVKDYFACDDVVLMGETNLRLRGERIDIVRYVESLSPSLIPWKRY
jgi:hypothetical protein